MSLARAPPRVLPVSRYERTSARPSSTFENLADVRQHVALLPRQRLRQQLLVAPHHPSNRVLVGLDAEHLERADGDLIVGQARRLRNDDSWKS